MPDSPEPVSSLAENSDGGLDPGIGLAVSGGGYRAMLFHLGSFWRLFELGLLKKLNRISSVSGGSITSAKVGLEWEGLNSRQDFVDKVVGPVRKLAGITVDASSIIGGILLPGSVADRVSAAYRSTCSATRPFRTCPTTPAS